MNYKTLLIAVLASILLVLSFSMTACAAFITPQSFTHITLREWVNLGVFTPVILQPAPGETRLLMGPMLAENAGRVELYYSQEFEPDVIPPVYELYESARPLAVGMDILSQWGATNKDVTTERFSMALAGEARLVELRQNIKQPDMGVIIFEMEGTHLVCHWQNVKRDAALGALVTGLWLVRAGDVETILAFDQKLFRAKD